MGWVTNSSDHDEVNLLIYQKICIYIISVLAKHIWWWFIYLISNINSKWIHYSDLISGDAKKSKFIRLKNQSKTIWQHNIDRYIVDGTMGQAHHDNEGPEGVQNTYEVYSFNKC